MLILKLCRYLDKKKLRVVNYFEIDNSCVRAKTLI